MEVFMSYSQDFREFVVGKIHAGMPRSDAIDFFNVSRDSIHKWLKKSAETGNVIDKKRKEYKPKKIISQILMEELSKTPDATLQELSEHFSCSKNAIWKRLKKLDITRKKNHAIRRAK
jgi:transposase